MSETNTVSPLSQRMIEDMAARKLNPHTLRAPTNEAMTLQQPLADGVLKVVAKGARQDGMAELI